jgi:hypothetical protein
MADDALNARLVAVVEHLNAAGDCWGSRGVEIAGVTVRRWRSYARRHKKAKHVRPDDRVTDLAKGLQVHFEPDIAYTHPSDWRALAEALAKELPIGVG